MGICDPIKQNTMFSEIGEIGGCKIGEFNFCLHDALSPFFFDLALSRFACGTQPNLGTKCVLGSGDPSAVVFGLTCKHNLNDKQKQR